jgi:hypothetical protein
VATLRRRRRNAELYSTFAAAADGVVAEPEAEVEEHRGEVGRPVHHSLQHRGLGLQYSRVQTQGAESPPPLPPSVAKTGRNNFEPGN